MSGFDEPYWNSLQLLIWVYLGDRSLIAQCGPNHEQADRWYWAEQTVLDERGVSTRQLVNTPAGKPSVLKLQLWAAAKGHHSSIQSAEQEIVGKLQEGTIIATGQTKDGKRQNVPVLDWLDICIEYDDNSALHKHHRSVIYRDLRFSRGQVLRIWADALGDLTEDGNNLAPAQASGEQTGKSLNTRRDATRPKIAEAVKALRHLDKWRTSDKSRCTLVEQHLSKPNGWCTVSTLRRAIADLDKARPATLPL
jgi:hypothetical protein